MRRRILPGTLRLLAGRRHRARRRTAHAVGDVYADQHRLRADHEVGAADGPEADAGHHVATRRRTSSRRDAERDAVECDAPTYRERSSTRPRRGPCCRRVRAEADRDVHADRHRRTSRLRRPSSPSLSSPRAAAARRAGQDRHDDRRHLRRRDRALESVAPGVLRRTPTVWWLFTLSSAHDAFGDQTVQALRSSGPDLATATWTAASSARTCRWPVGRPTPLLAGGRSLGVALRTIGTTDYVHVFVSAALDGQVVVERPHPCAARRRLDHLAGPVEQSGLAQRRIGMADRPARHGASAARDTTRRGAIRSASRRAASSITSA